MQQEPLFKPLPSTTPPDGAAGRDNPPPYAVVDTHIAAGSSQSTIMSLADLNDTSDEAGLLNNMECNEKSQRNFFQKATVPSPPQEGAGSTDKNNPPPYSITDSHDAGSTNQSTIISLPVIIENPDIARLVKSMEFNDKTLRRGFIRKVYSILMSQLLLTGLIIFGFMQIPQSGVYFIRENFWQVYAAPLITYITTFICILCCEGPRRRVPFNYMFLLLFTISLAVMVGLVTAMCKAEEVLMAAGITFTIVLGLTLFAFQTKIDFTLLTGSCLCLTLALLMLGITVLATSYDRMRLVYLTIGVIFISIYIVWDTQMIIGGEHRFAFSAEEYVFAALILYVDVMYLFMRILRSSR